MLLKKKTHQATIDFFYNINCMWTIFFYVHTLTFSCGQILNLYVYEYKILCVCLILK